MITVLLGLTSSLAWGISDFVGGTTSRRAPLLGVLAFTQAIGVVIALTIGSARGEGALSSADIGWVVISAILGATGLGCLYHGLAVGRMGVVAPVTGVLVAAIPVTVGIILDGVPSPAVVAGIALAIASVVIVARIPGEAGGGGSGLWWGIGAGATLGLFTVAVSRISEGLVFVPLALMRGIETVAFVVLILAGRRAWRVRRELWPALLLIGTLDMGATAAYIAATQAGPLAIAAVLSALYPVVTVILAAAILRERVTRVHAFGIGGALVAIVLITGGTAA